MDPETIGGETSAENTEVNARPKAKKPRTIRKRKPSETKKANLPEQEFFDTSVAAEAVTEPGETDLSNEIADATEAETIMPPKRKRIVRRKKTPVHTEPDVISEEERPLGLQEEHPADMPTEEHPSADILSPELPKIPKKRAYRRKTGTPKSVPPLSEMQEQLSDTSSDFLAPAETSEVAVVDLTAPAASAVAGVDVLFQPFPATNEEDNTSESSHAPAGIYDPLEMPMTAPTPVDLTLPPDFIPVTDGTPVHDPLLANSEEIESTGADIEPKITEKPLTKAQKRALAREAAKATRLAKKAAKKAKADALKKAKAAQKAVADKTMLVSVIPNEMTEVVITQKGIIDEYYVEMAHQAKLRGNIYKAVISNIDPNLQAAFVDFGLEKNGFLQIDEIHPEYYQAHVTPERGSKYPPIQKILKQGQEVLVQVVKEPTGAKGAFLTTYVSLAGRFLILTPGQEQIGVSRKVESAAERNRLKDALCELDPEEGIGVIIRTVSEGIDKEVLQKDFAYLMGVWNDILGKVQSTKGPCLIYEEPNIANRSIRDYLSDEIQEIWVDDKATEESMRQTLQMLFPNRTIPVHFYNPEKSTMWTRFNITKQLEQIHSREVLLPSGGRLVFDQTEALMAIDINSGKSGGKNNFESTAVQTNLEAAREIARQLRLRDVGGQIVIDFIEMHERSKPREIERAMTAAMKIDRARHDIGRMSPFGLLEIVRQRIGSSAISLSQEPCPHCGGTGMRRNMEWQSLQLLRELPSALAIAVRKKQSEFVLGVSPELGAYFLNEKRNDLIELEQRFHIKITVKLTV